MPASTLTLKARRGLRRGFTLIEMMVVLTLVGILATLAAPSFVDSRKTAELVSASSDLMSAILSARAKAMETGRATYVMPLNAGTWSGGWVAFVDVDLDGAYTAGTDTLVIQHPALPTEVAEVTPAGVNGMVNASGKRYVSFAATGFPRSDGGTFASGSIELQASATDQPKRLIVIGLAGKVRACNPVIDPTCHPD